MFLIEYIYRILNDYCGAYIRCVSIKNFALASLNFFYGTSTLNRTLVTVETLLQLQMIIISLLKVLSTS